MSLKQDRADLVQRLARVTANRQHLEKVRGALRDRATEQLDTMPHAISTASDYVRQRKGGVLAYRFLRAKLTEAARLRGIAARTEGSDATDD